MKCCYTYGYFSVFMVINKGVQYGFFRERFEGQREKSTMEMSGAKYCSCFVKWQDL